jgi:putative ABC transport system substrate-binding protein
MPVIGFLSSTSAAPYKTFVDAFSAGLAAKGYVQGKNVAIQYRWADGQYERLGGLADDLVRLRASVIVAISPPAAQAAKSATSSIPIVFSTSGDPVALGLVSSPESPGQQFDGRKLHVVAMAAKRLDLLTKLAPKASIIGLLVNPNNPSSAPSSADAQAAAQALGKKLIVANAGTEDEIDASFIHLVQQKWGHLGGGRSLPTHQTRPSRCAGGEAFLPVIYPHRENAEVGGLASYGTDLADAYRQIGVYTGRVLNGEQPASLPVMQVTKFEMVINMRTAKTLGLVVPPDVISLADEVIE